MDSIQTKENTSKKALRLAVGAMFFMAGLCFSSWTSRIASIQHNLGISVTGLGAILSALPVGLMISLPLSGWLITKIGSRRLLMISLTLYGLTLVTLGMAQNSFQLVCCLLFYGLSSNAANISINTQAVYTEKVYNRPIMASFHGLWSLAGFTGAGIGAYMIGKSVMPFHHFIIIAVVMVVCIIAATRWLHDDKTASSGPIFVMPDSSLIKLGVIAFCSMMCEGAMFDWSTIYFRDIIHPDHALIGAGFACFMGAMASGRLFIADWFANRYGIKRILQVSGSLTAAGLLIAVALPYFFTAIGGFILVGLGVSSVVPMVYSAAGKSKTMAPGVALAAVSTIGFSGFLIAPPVIGFIAGLATLRASFILIACMGLSVVVVSTKTKL